MILLFPLLYQDTLIEQSPHGCSDVHVIIAMISILTHQ